jgi:hypothetical protein
VGRRGRRRIKEGGELVGLTQVLHAAVLPNDVKVQAQRCHGRHWQWQQCGGGGWQANSIGCMQLLLASRHAYLCCPPAVADLQGHPNTNRRHCQQGLPA